MLLDRYLNDATEVDVDAVSDGKQVIIGGVMEHIEQAGVHSGDSACSLPPFSLAPELQAGYQAYYLRSAGRPGGSFTSVFALPDAIANAISRQLDIVLGGI